MALTKERNPRRALQATEAEWSRTFKQLLTTLGWTGYHTWMSRFSEAGYPDWTCFSVRQQRVIWVELKSETGKVSQAQQKWIDALRACGQEVYVWRPSDFEEAAEILKGFKREEIGGSALL